MSRTAHDPTPTAPRDDAFFAEMADGAIRRMLGNEPTDAAEALAEVTLDPEEEAALAAAEAGESGGDADAEEDAAEDAAEDAEEDAVRTTMPTDEELDALLRGEAAPPASPAKAAPPELFEEAPSPAGAALAAEMDEKPAAAAAPAPAPPKAAPVVAPAADAAVRDATPGTPLWLAPLVWVNAPLRRAPRPVRDAIGKVGLVTLLNAAAVIVYAVVIRR